MAVDRMRRSLLAATGAAGLASLAGVAALAAEPRVIKVVAKKFVYVPDRIEVKQGESVVLELTAPEVPMGFNLPDFKVRADVIPGQMATVRFTADKAGSFTFLCDVFCGQGHEDMSGMLVVT
jgi:cytochrome c oxidase subunit 2